MTPRELMPLDDPIAGCGTCLLTQNVDVRPIEARQSRRLVAPDLDGLADWYWIAEPRRGTARWVDRRSPRRQRRPDRAGRVAVDGDRFYDRIHNGVRSREMTASLQNFAIAT
jgi:hypothetical protein